MACRFANQPLLPLSKAEVVALHPPLQTARLYPAKLGSSLTRQGYSMLPVGSP